MFFFFCFGLVSVAIGEDGNHEFACRQGEMLRRQLAIQNPKTQSKVESCQHIELDEMSKGVGRGLEEKSSEY